MSKRHLSEIDALDALDAPVAKRQRLDEKKYRLQGSRLFLTYPQCDLECKDALDKLMEIVDISDYIIAKEEHKDGNKYLHCYLKLNKRCDFKNPNCLDLEDYHGNYQTAKNEYAVKKYCKKNGDYITNMEFDIIKDIIDTARLGDVKGAVNQISEHMPMEIIRHGSKIAENLSVVFDNKITIKYDRSQFNELPGVLEWEEKYKSTHVLWIHGPSGLGKTEYVKSLFNKPLLVSHADKLKQMSFHSYDGIIFDDCNFSHWPRESCIHLVDVENERDINVKHSMVTIPESMVRVFTSNVPIFKYDETGAISRRVYYVWCDRDLRKTIKKDKDYCPSKIPDSAWVRDPEWHGPPSNITKEAQPMITKDFVDPHELNDIRGFHFNDGDMENNKIEINYDESDNDINK